MDYYTVDVRGAKTHAEFYNCIIAGMRFPDWCGDNADAIWDMLTGYTDDPAEISIYGMKGLPHSLSRDVQLIETVFKKAETWYAESGDHFKVRFID